MAGQVTTVTHPQSLCKKYRPEDFSLNPKHKPLTPNSKNLHRPDKTPKAHIPHFKDTVALGKRLESQALNAKPSLTANLEGTQQIRKIPQQSSLKEPLKKNPQRNPLTPIRALEGFP